MALIDYIWLVRLVMEILKLIADMTEDERAAMARLRVEMPIPVACKHQRRETPIGESPNDDWAQT